MDEGRIFLAKEKFVKGDYKNKNMHDTHAPEEEKDIKYYPQDLKISKIIQKQLKDLFTLTGSIDEYFKCFTESNDCYQLFGFDVMITKDYQVKILEVNSGPGTRSLIMPFWKKLFENQLKLMVDTTFPPKNKVDEDSGFVQVY